MTVDPRKLGLRLAAAVAASLLVAGCGTRLNDSQIEAAAGVGGAGGGQAASGAPAPGAADTGVVNDTGTAPASTDVATGTGTAAAVTPAAGSSAAPVAGATSS